MKIRISGLPIEKLKQIEHLQLFDPSSFRNARIEATTEEVWLKWDSH